MIDFNPFSNNMTVVHCKSIEEAQKFFNEMRDLHPEYMRAWREDGATVSWSLYKNETAYWPIRYDDGECKLEYCSCDFFRRNGYDVLSFEEVVFDLQDYGEFDTDQIDETTLFGILYNRSLI